MIRINLLPKEERRESKGLGEFLIGVLVIVAVLGLVVATHIIRTNRLESIRAETNKVEKRIAELEDVKNKVDDFKAKNEELRRRIEIIQVLEENRTGPLYVMDALSDVIPERAWVDKFSESGFQAKFDGMAWNEFTVASFMKELQSSPYFRNVRLGVIKKEELRNLPLRSFVIEADLNYSGKSEQEKEEEDNGVLEEKNAKNQRKAKR